VGADKVEPWAPNRHKVANAVDAIRGITHLPETVSAPAWLDDGNHLPVANIVAAASGLLHVSTRQLLPLYFTLVSVTFPYAPEPTRWLAFLHSLWPDDEASIRAVQDWFGYVISGRTDLQKILLMTGPLRSGKGTIARVLEALLGGRGNVAGSTMALLATNFGLEPLVGKALCVISDARLSS
jgi:putative DNA primase/helicase